MALSPLPPASRYRLLARIASGGMASVFVGTVRGAAGFRKLRAIKRAHPHLLEDPTYARMLAAEARLAARIDHPHVVSMEDVEEHDGELLLVMEYVEGASLSELLKTAKKRGIEVSPRIIVRVLLDAQSGLHAAHELRDESGQLLGFVHRDVSPQNILVSRDGVAKIADFGVAKTSKKEIADKTATGVLKGKVAYMAPEYVRGRDIDRRADIFSLAVVGWESLAGRPLFSRDNELITMQEVAFEAAPLLSEASPELGPLFDDTFRRALEKSPTDRFSNMADFRDALCQAAERQELVATPMEVAEVVEGLFGTELDARRDEAKRAEVALSTNPDVRALLNPSRASQPENLTSAAVAASLTTPTNAPRTWLWPTLVALLLVGAGGLLFLRTGSNAAQVAPAGGDTAPPELASAEPPSPEEPKRTNAVETPVPEVSLPTASASVVPRVPASTTGVPRWVPPSPRPPSPPPAPDSPDPNPYR